MDEAASRLLQERYLDGERGALGGLYMELRCIAESCIRWYARKKHFTVDNVEELAHDAASTIISRYLRTPGYRIERFWRAVFGVCREMLFDSHRKRQAEQGALRLASEQAYYQHENTTANPAGYVVGMIEARGVDGKRIVVDLAYSRSYSKAVKRIATYTRHEWMQNNAVQLRYVYRMTHGKEIGSGDARRGNVGRGATAVQPVRSVAEPSGRDDAEVLDKGEARE